MKLSKTDFLICEDCAKNAWLKIHKPEIYKKFPLSSFDLNIIETGNEIDKLARGLFPGGITINSRDDFDLTKKIIADHEKIIYQPTFAGEKFTMAADIFVWNNESGLYDLYEVKSSTSSEESENKKTRDYLTDMAFQKNVLNDLGIKIGETFLIRLNKKYVRDQEIDINSLFLIENYTDEVNLVLDEVRARMDGAYEYLSKTDEPKGYCDCILKGWNSHCTTSEYSIPDLPEYPVHAISRINKNKLQELVDSNIINIHDVSADFVLSESQRRQVDVAQSGRIFSDTESIQNFLQKIEYPIAFLDYETYPSAIPKYIGYSPYEQVPFQFSLHVLNFPGAKLEHYDFLHVDNNCPDESFAQNLQKFLPATGSIIVWNERFEKGINIQIARHISSFQKFMGNVNARVIDLMIPFYGKTSMYDHPKFMGSASIKYVLPALVPEMSYANLEIKEGGTAADTWNRIIGGEYLDEEKEFKIESLKKYCEQDTLAMVKIWEFLSGL